MLSDEQYRAEFSAIRKNIETAVEEVILIAAKKLQERIPDIIRTSKEEIARQLSKPTVAEGEEYPSSDSSTSSFVTRTLSPMDNQSSVLLLASQERGSIEGTQPSIGIQSQMGPESFTNGQSALRQRSRSLDPLKLLLEGTDSLKPVATGNPNLDAGLGILNDVDWERLDESLINLDWSNLP
jgi:hypothetical protein